MKDHVLRYAVTNQPTLEGIIDAGELVIDNEIIDDGKLINQKAFQTVLEQLVKEKGWKNKPLSFCVPDSYVTIREQLVPKQLTRDEIKRYIQMELQDSIRLPFSNPVFDFDVIGEQEDQKKLLLFAYPKERLQDFMQVFDKVGLNPKVADLSFLSLYRLYYQLDVPAAEDHLLLVQWNKDAIVLTAFHQHKPMFTRYVKSPVAPKAWVLKNNEWSWSSSEQELAEVAEEQLVIIERFMDFYQYSLMDGAAQFTRILLFGDFPNLSQIAKQIDERNNITVELLEKWEEQLQKPVKYADVIGLSVKKRNK